MNKITKIVIALLAIFTVYVIIILSPSKELGSFDKIREGGEINQSVNVRFDDTMGIITGKNNQVIAFYALDRYNNQAKVSLREPLNFELKSAEIIQLFGHLHGNEFIAVSVSKLD